MGRARAVAIASAYVCLIVLAFAIGWNASEFRHKNESFVEPPKHDLSAERAVHRAQVAVDKITKSHAVLLGAGDGTEKWIEAVKKHVQNKYIIYTWVNYHMRDFLVSFLLHLRRENMTNFVIGALDPETTTFLRTLAPRVSMRIPVLDLHSGLKTGDYGWNSAAFKLMAKYKFQAVQQLLSHGIDVLVLDTDAPLLKNPTQLFKNLSDPDILISTDILRRASLRDQIVSTQNIGIIYLRARPVVVDFITKFYTDLVDDPHFGTEKAEWDQGRWNRMMKQGWRFTAESGDSMLAWDSRLKVQALDIVDAPNGHVMYVQKLTQKLGTLPSFTHNTFQFGGTAGKRHRFREAQLWLTDPTEDNHVEYYDSPRGYLSFDCFVDPDLLRDAPSSIEAHFELVHSQLAQLRSAYGIAKALNRVLVLPPLAAGLDRAWFPHFAPGDGRFPGSDSLFALPFTAPADHILDFEQLEKLDELHNIRESSFLNNSATAAAVRHEPDVRRDIPDGLTDTEARMRLSSTARRLHLQSLKGATFDRFENQKEQDAFMTLMRNINGLWCCSAGGHVWYDALADIKPHVDRHGRSFTDGWRIVFGP